MFTQDNAEREQNFGAQHPLVVPAQIASQRAGTSVAGLVLRDQQQSVLAVSNGGAFVKLDLNTGKLADIHKQVYLIACSFPFFVSPSLSCFELIFPK